MFYLCHPSKNISHFLLRFMEPLGDKVCSKDIAFGETTVLLSEFTAVVLFLASFFWSPPITELRFYAAMLLNLFLDNSSYY